MVEDLIREAMERGDFDDLPGKGKPLNLQKELDQNPFVDSMTVLVNRIVREHGASHPLLEARKMIAAETAECRAELQRARAKYLSSGDVDPWASAVAAFRARVMSLNREIRLFNLKAPSPAFHGLVMDAETEIRNVVAETPK